MTSAELTAYLDERRAEFEDALKAALPSAPDCPAVLADAMQYSLLAGGKRLRPMLCLAACEAVGGNRTSAMPAACALEFIHTYSLVHDDLPAMDNDTLRRGRPTLHVVAGEGMAILAGDGLLTEAFTLLSRSAVESSPATAARTLRVIAIIARAAGVVGMVGGQAIDLTAIASSASSAVTLPELQSMHARKTGALIRASAAAGAVMGGASDEVVHGIDAAAADFGLAFQIVDDILDIEGKSSDLGKTPGKDAAAGKPTYPALVGVDRSRSMAAECVNRATAVLTALPIDSTYLLALGHAMVERTRGGGRCQSPAGSTGRRARPGGEPRAGSRVNHRRTGQGCRNRGEQAWNDSRSRE
jgi:geranylgeranyl diphosphate synthase type II